MLALVRINTQGRLRFVDGDDEEPVPGIRCYTGGKHTWTSQYVGVQTAAGTVVFASDNMYLYENLDSRAPIAQTLDAASNLGAQERIRTIAAEPKLIVPGHDPAVFERYPRIAEGAGTNSMKTRSPRSLKNSTGFQTFVVDQLEGLDVIEKSMFGGCGLYCREDFFGIIAADVLIEG